KFRMGEAWRPLCQIPAQLRTLSANRADTRIMANALVWQANEGAVTNRSRLRSPEDIQPCPCGEHLTHRIDTESTRTVVPGDVNTPVVSRDLDGGVLEHADGHRVIMDVCEDNRRSRGGRWPQRRPRPVADDAG